MTEKEKTAGLGRSQNKFDQEQPLRHALVKVARNDDKLTINHQLYKIIVDKQEALDLEVLRKKYDPYLDQYDFIVGDVSSEHLRLKGFYHNGVKAAIDRKEQTIADYLLEYCNPGGAYFILELLEPVHPRRNRMKNKHTGRRAPHKKNNFSKKYVHQTTFVKHDAAEKKKQSYHHSFVIRKRKG